MEKTMRPEEVHERYYAAKKEAESELQAYMHAMTSEADLLDRLEMSFLWRSFLEGNSVTPMTWEMMLEATNP